MIEATLSSYPVIFWASVGVIFLVIEMLMASGFFVSFSVAAFAVAGISWLNMPWLALLWKILIFFVLGVVLVPVFRGLMRRYFDRTPDINEY